MRFYVLRGAWVAGSMHFYVLRGAWVVEFMHFLHIFTFNLRRYLRDSRSLFMFLEGPGKQISSLFA